MDYLGNWLPTAIGVVALVATAQVGAVAKSAQEVNKMAKAITVKISFATQGGLGNGSGILLQKQGDVYTVLTAAHVVQGKSGKPLSQLTLTTPDDHRHKIMMGSVKVYSGDVDLAIVKFRSDKSYQLAQLGDSNKLEEGMELYVAGFPAPTKVITESVYVFREGKVTANSKRVFKDGYALLYSNDTLPGMSGGPVLNGVGQVVGIHGKGDREQESLAKTGFNAGIPIARLADAAGGLGVETGVARTVQSPALTADDYYISANQKYANRNYQGALTDYNKAISIKPNYTAAYNNRGALKFLKLRDTQGALADFNKAITLDPTHANAYSNRGALKHQQLNDPQGAMADYNRAVSLNPNLAKAYYNRGLLKDDLKDTRGALDDYNKSISLDPSDADAYNNRGLLKDDLKDTQGALDDYNQAISLRPDNPYFYINRGALKYLGLNDPQGALLDSNKAISLDPNNAKAYGLRGLVKQDRLDDRQGAIADFKKAAILARAQGETSVLQVVTNRLRALGASE
jgi:tetratricopeptide (TPR) repeat protein/V8-like Glu-specific endopeptidase